MNKSRQKELTRWLKQQSVISQRWLNISRLLGFVSGIVFIRFFKGRPVPSRVAERTDTGLLFISQ